MKAHEDNMKSMDAEAAAVKTLAAEINTLSKNENKSAAQKAELSAKVKALNDLLGETVVQYDAEADAIKGLGEGLDTLVEKRLEAAKAAAAQERLVEIAKEQAAADEEQRKVKEKLKEALDAIGMTMEEFSEKSMIEHAARAGLNKDYEESMKVIGDLAGQYVDLQGRLDDLGESWKYNTGLIVENAVAQAEAAEEVTERVKTASEIQSELVAQRKAEDDALTESMIENASAQGLTLEEYKKKLDQTQKDEEAAYKKREDTLKKYTETATDMFKRLDDKSKTTVSEMTKNMQHNQKVIEDWADNIAVLAEKGIDKGLLEKLREAGPESAGTVAALVAASDTELQELSTVFANGSEVATDALLKQLGLPDVVNSGSDMVDNIAGGVDTNDNLRTAAERLIQEAKATAEQAVRGSGFEDIGKGIVEGVWQGIKSMESWFRSQVNTFFKGIVDSVKASLGIQSPSKVFAGIGMNMAQGLGLGFGAEMDKVARDMQNVIPTDINMTGSASIQPSGGDSARQIEAVVNAFSTLSAGAGASGDLQIQFIFNDHIFASAAVPAFRRVMAASPVVVADF